MLRKLNRIPSEVDGLSMVPSSPMSSSSREEAMLLAMAKTSKILAPKTNMLPPVLVKDDVDVSQRTLGTERSDESTALWSTTSGSRSSRGFPSPSPGGRQHHLLGRTRDRDEFLQEKSSIFMSPKPDYCEDYLFSMQQMLEADDQSDYDLPDLATLATRSTVSGMSFSTKSTSTTTHIASSKRNRHSKTQSTSSLSTNEFELNDDDWSQFGDEATSRRSSGHSKLRRHSSLSTKQWEIKKEDWSHFGDEEKKRPALVKQRRGLLTKERSTSSLSTNQWESSADDWFGDDATMRSERSKHLRSAPAIGQTSRDDHGFSSRKPDEHEFAAFAVHKKSSLLVTPVEEEDEDDGFAIIHRDTQDDIPLCVSVIPDDDEDEQGNITTGITTSSSQKAASEASRYDLLVEYIMCNGNHDRATAEKLASSFSSERVSGSPSTGRSGSDKADPAPRALEAPLATRSHSAQPGARKPMDGSPVPAPSPLKKRNKSAGMPFVLPSIVEGLQLEHDSSQSDAGFDFELDLSSASARRTKKGPLGAFKKKCAGLFLGR